MDPRELNLNNTKDCDSVSYSEIFNEGHYIKSSMSIKLSNDSKSYVGM